MENNLKGTKYDSFEYLFDKIFETMDSIVERMDKTDAGNQAEWREIKRDIAFVQADVKIFLNHYDIVHALGDNLSPEGLREMVADVTELKKYMTTLREREEQKKDHRDTYLKIGIPVFVFILGVIWWILQNYFMIVPHTLQTIQSIAK